MHPMITMPTTPRCGPGGAAGFASAGASAAGRPPARAMCWTAPAFSDCSEPSATAASAPCSRRTRSPVHDVVNSAAAARWLPTCARRCRLGSVTISATSRCTPTPGPTSRRKSVNAHAYTVGSNVVFQRDKYDPSSAEGKTMLAHELTHVVQQRSGPVDGTSAGGGIKVSDPSDRFEREAAANADRVMSARRRAGRHRRRRRAARRCSATRRPRRRKTSPRAPSSSARRRRRKRRRSASSA